MAFLQCLLVGFVAEAQVRSNLYTRPEIKNEIADHPSLKKKKAKSTLQYVTTSARGNLDSEILVVSPSYRSEDTQVILPSSPKGVRLKSIRIGDVIKAEIPESLFAFPESKAPIIAKVKNGDLKGSLFIGEATLERNSKRILVEFKKYRPASGLEDYQLLASVLDAKGVLGLEGQYVNQEPSFFAAEFLAAGAAGYADASVERSQNSFGNYVEAPTADTLGKKALSSALSKTAEKFAEKIKSAPEYSILEGPVEIQILIIDQPKLNE